jgi:soluble cytochrome b562
MNTLQMTQTQFDDYKRRINEVNDRLVSSLRRTVSDAIELGGILCEVKEKIGHGGFLPWIEKHCGINERSCRRYMEIYQYKSKTDRVSDLQEAYAQIETLKAQEKREVQEKRDKMMREYKKTGIKPDGWDRSCDYEYKKYYDDEERNVRVKSAIDIKEKEAEETRKRIKEREEKAEKMKSSIDDVQKMIDEERKRQIDKDNFRKGITDGAKFMHAFLDVIDDYLNNLSDNNRRIEACNNIISHCKHIAIKLHGESVK